MRTRRTENDNTPQPLDQWTKSPFIGQQVGNCKSFTLTHYLADLFAMHRGPRSIPMCIQHHIQLTSLSWVMGEVKVWSHNVSLTFYRLTSLSLHVNRPSHSWDTKFSNFDLENPRSRSWKRWTLKVTTWVQHSIDSHPFHSMLIGHPTHKIRLFRTLTSKTKVKVLIDVKVESHKVGVTSFRLTSLSFHVNRPSHSRDTALSKLNLENPRSMSWVRWTLKVTTFYQLTSL